MKTLWRDRDNGEGIWLREQQEQRQRGVKLRGESEVSAIKPQFRPGGGRGFLLHKKLWPWMTRRKARKGSENNTFGSVPLPLPPPAGALD